MELVRPNPQPDPISQGFWDAAARGELAIQRCVACRAFQHPPRPICRSCGGTELSFETVSGGGRLWSWTTTHHSVISGFEPALPYTIMLIELAEQPGLFLLSDLIGRGGAWTLQLGAKMRAIFPAGGEAAVLPQFVPAAREQEVPS
jgi:uncharacterized protein